MKRVELTGIRIVLKELPWKGRGGEILKDLENGFVLVKVDGLTNYWELERDEYEFVTKLGEVLK